MNVSLENYEPLQNYILLKLDPKKKTEGGLFLPKAVQDRWMEVVKTGSLCEMVSEGDIVLVGDLHGQVSLTFGDDKYIQIPEHFVVGKVEPAKEIKFTTNST